MTQTERILRHLREIGPITQMDAIRDYGCTRLGARIFDLKRMGYPIKAVTVTGKNRFGETTHYAEYRLEGSE